MGIEIIHNQSDALRLRIIDIDQITNGIRPINFSAMVSHLNEAFTNQRLKEHEEISSAMSLVLIVAAHWLTRFQRERLGDFADQLFT